MNNLVTLKNICNGLINVNRCVYKRCAHSKLVVMEKLPETRTNEKRTNVSNFLFAKFRADMLKTVAIFDIHNPQKRIHRVANRFKDDCVEYSVGNVTVASGFDESLNLVKGRGLHYFHTLDCAFYFRDPVKSYSGPWYEWYHSGSPMKCGDVINGKPVGRWTEWYPDGTFKGHVDYQDLKTS